MYTPTKLKEDRPEILRSLIRSYPLATLIVSLDGEMSSITCR